MSLSAVTTSASTSEALKNHNGRHIDRCQNGVLWTIHKTDAAQLRLSYSLDNGQSWTDGGLVPQVGNMWEASMFIDLDDQLHLAWHSGDSSHTIYYNRAVPANSGRTAWTWDTSPTFLQNSNRGGPDLVAHRSGTGWTVHVVWGSHTSGAMLFTEYKRIAISSSGARTVSSHQGAGMPSGNAQAGAFPSIDFHHIGDGKTVKGGTPHVYIASYAYDNAFGYHLAKVTWNGSTWGSPSALGRLFGNYVGAGGGGLHWDGYRLVGAILGYDGSSYQPTFVAHDGSSVAAGTATPLGWPVPASPGSNGIAVSYERDTQDVYVFATGDTTGVYVKSFDRSAGTWAAWTQLSNLANVQLTGLDARAGSDVKRLDWLVADTLGGVFADAIAFNSAPNAPSLTTMHDGGVIDRAVVNRASHDFSDPDAGDSQSAFDHRYRLVGSPTWTEAYAGTASGFVDYPAGTFAAGEYERQVRTYDSLGEAGPWSASGFFTAADAPAAPTITDPPNGSTVSSESASVSWTAAQQSAYQLQVLDGGLVEYDTGEVADAGARTRPAVPFPDNGVTRTVRLRVKYGGLWSAWYSVAVTVSYTVPPTPSFTLNPSGTELVVLITNPAPGVGQPTVIQNEIFVTDPGKTEERRAVVGPNGSWTYRLPASGVAYDQLVRVVAHGDNGTRSSS